MPNEIFKSCEKYMLTEENIIKCYSYFLSEKSSKKPNKKPNKVFEKPNKVFEKPSKKPNKVFEKPNTDKLFWCFFIILHGEHEYEMDSSFKREKEFKINSIEKLRTIKPQLKAIKLSLNFIENELSNEKKITLPTLIALCLLYKINILYIWNRKYFEMINNDTEQINIIINEKGEDKITENETNEKIDYYKNNFWQIENINKPLKAITSYTRDELINIINKLEIIVPKKTKKEMYEKILESI